MTQLNSLACLLVHSGAGEGGSKVKKVKGTEESVRSEGGANRDTLEEGGLNIKRSHSEGALVERKELERGFELKPPLLFLSLCSFESVGMGNRGSQEQQDTEGRCHLVCLFAVPSSTAVSSPCTL